MWVPEASEAAPPPATLTLKEGPQDTHPPTGRPYLLRRAYTPPGTSHVRPRLPKPQPPLARHQPPQPGSRLAPAAEPRLRLTTAAAAAATAARALRLRGGRQDVPARDRAVSAAPRRSKTTAAPSHWWVRPRASQHGRRAHPGPRGWPRPSEPHRRLRPPGAPARPKLASLPPRPAPPPGAGAAPSKAGPVSRPGGGCGRSRSPPPPRHPSRGSLAEAGWAPPPLCWPASPQLPAWRQKR